MSGQEFRFSVAPLVSATYAIEGETLVFKQGVRRTAIPLAQIRAFAVREFPPFLGMSASQLLIRVATERGEKTRKMSFDPRAARCQDLLAALRVSIPAADATGLVWDAAAARVGVTARPWYRVFLEPRTSIGIVLLGAAAFANTSMMSASASREERLGQGIVGVGASAVAIWLIVSGIRRARARS
jgi:hypothetical protein